MAIPQLRNESMVARAPSEQPRSWSERQLLAEGGLWPTATRSKASGAATYGGGRYLYDTIKGADLGVGERSFVLDFNYAYNPRARTTSWSCPLSPAENRLAFAVEAGERMD